MSNRRILVIGGSSAAVAPLRHILGMLPADLLAAIFAGRWRRPASSFVFPARGSVMCSPIWSASSRGAALPVPPEIRLEVAIAAGECVGGDGRDGIVEPAVEPAALICPSCGGGLSNPGTADPVRLRCELCRDRTADIRANERENGADEALRIIKECAEPVQRMAGEGRQSGRSALARMYQAHAVQYRASDMICGAMLQPFCTNHEAMTVLRMPETMAFESSV